MRYDNKVKKAWYVTTLGTFFNDQPKDEEEEKYFKSVMDEAKKHGAKVKEVWFNITEEEFFKRHYKEAETETESEE